MSREGIINTVSYTLGAFGAFEAVLKEISGAAIVAFVLGFRIILAIGHHLVFVTYALRDVITGHARYADVETATLKVEVLIRITIGHGLEV